jgi:hypothetical protein
MGTNTTLNFLLQRPAIILRSLYGGGEAGTQRQPAAHASTDTKLSRQGGHVQRAIDSRLIDTEIVSGLNKYTFVIISFGF